MLYHFIKLYVPLCKTVTQTAKVSLAGQWVNKAAARQREEIQLNSVPFHAAEIASPSQPLFSIFKTRTMEFAISNLPLLQGFLREKNMTVWSFVSLRVPTQCTYKQAYSVFTVYQQYPAEILILSKGHTKDLSSLRHLTSLGVHSLEYLCSLSGAISVGFQSRNFFEGSYCQSQTTIHVNRRNTSVAKFKLAPRLSISKIV